MKRASFLLVAVALAACAPEPLPPIGHVVVHFDTDAPLPSSIETVAVEPLFDRLLVEVFEPGATTPCVGCRRELPLDVRDFREHTASIQIPARAGNVGYRVRARLYLARNTAGAEPLADGAVESVVALPAAPSEGGVEVTIVLAADAVGTKRGSLAAPIQADEGPPRGTKVGSWRGAAKTPCEGAAGPGEACVPGGAFWMGRPGGRALLEDFSSSRPRLVVVPPFYLDENEVTVADFRRARFERGYAPWTGARSGTNDNDLCTFTSDVGEGEALPMSCVSWPVARHYCLARGKELPTEARFEYAAGGLASRQFAWGEDPPACDDALWGVGGPGRYAPIAAPCARREGGSPCIVGAACESMRRRDFLTLGGRRIRDLHGSISEWMLDRFDTEDEPCWVASGLRNDPLCALPTTRRPRYSVRGGSWLSGAAALTAASRDAFGVSGVFSTIGFRCARAAVQEVCGPVRPGFYVGKTTGSESATLETIGVGCSGVVSAVATHGDGSLFLVGGAISSTGEIVLEGEDFATRDRQRFVGRVVDETHIGGSWTSPRGRGEWEAAPKP